MRALVVGSLIRETKPGTGLSSNDLMWSAHLVRDMMLQRMSTEDWRADEAMFVVCLEFLRTHCWAGCRVQSTEYTAGYALSSVFKTAMLWKHQYV